MRTHSFFAFIFLLTTSLPFSATCQKAWRPLGTSSMLQFRGRAVTTDRDGALLAIRDYNNDNKNYNQIFRFNGTDWTELGGWHSLQADSAIYDICVSKSGIVYAGGIFRNSNGKPYVARYNGVNWQEVGAGLFTFTSKIRSLRTDSADNLYALTGTAIMKWNNVQWTVIDSGLNYCYDFTFDSHGQMIMAGSLDANPSEISVFRLTNTGWDKVKTATDSFITFDAIERIVCDRSGKIYAAGDFKNAQNQLYVNCFDPVTGWSELPHLPKTTSNYSLQINNLTLDENGVLYFGGWADSVSAKFLVLRWDGQTMTSLYDSNLDDHTNLFIDKDGALYSGVRVTNPQHFSQTEVSVARWNGQRWQVIAPQTNQIQGTFHSAVFARDGKHIFASITVDDSVSVGRNKTGVYEWNGLRWKRLGLLTDLTYPAKYLTVDKSNVLYAGEYRADSTKNYFYRWNGSAWTRLPYSSLMASATLTSMACDTSGNLYAGGFYDASTQPNYLLKWDGSTWAKLGNLTVGSPTSAYVNDIYVEAPNRIYLAGDFRDNSGNYYIPYWNGTTWQRLGTLAQSAVINSYTTNITGNGNGTIYAIGFVTQGSGLNTYGIVIQWDGTAWTALTGTPVFPFPTGGFLNDIACGASGKIYVSGGIQYNGSTVYHTVKVYNNGSWQDVSSSSDYVQLINPATLSLNSNEDIVTTTGYYGSDIYVYAGCTPGGSKVDSQSCALLNWKNQLISQSGRYISNYDNSIGCPMSDTLDAVLNIPVRQVSVTNCGSYYWPINKKTYHHSIVDTAAVRHGGVGCDTIVILHLTISPTAAFNLVQDTTTAHTWLAYNQCTGVAPLTYSWNWGDGSAASTGAYPTHTYANAGNYTICVQVTDGSGCSASYCDTANLFKNGNGMVYINVVSGINGIAAVAGDREWLIVENPCKECLIRAVNELSAADLVVFNAIGEIVSAPVTKHADGWVLHAEQLPAGIYTLYDKQRLRSLRFVRP